MSRCSGDEEALVLLMLALVFVFGVDCALKVTRGVCGEVEGLF